MHPIAQRAEVALRDHPHPALRLSELIGIIAPDTDRLLRVDRLRELLEQHPDTFRVLDPWRGPWRPAPPEGSPATGPGDAWVVVIGDPAARAEQSRTVTGRLRESVRWLSRSVDSRSPLNVTRWYAIVLSERATRNSIERRAA